VSVVTPSSRTEVWVPYRNANRAITAPA